AANDFLGTPNYASPDQVMGSRDVDGRADVYSYGAVLWQILAGRIPYWGLSPIEVLVAVVNDPLPELPDTVPKWLRDIVAKATSKDKEDRQPTAAALRDELVAGYRANEMKRSSARQATPSPQPTARAGGAQRLAKKDAPAYEDAAATVVTTSQEAPATLAMPEDEMDAPATVATTGGIWGGQTDPASPDTVITPARPEIDPPRPLMTTPGGSRIPDDIEPLVTRKVTRPPATPPPPELDSKAIFGIAAGVIAIIIVLILLL
ncbi:MAG: protein kinase, partial [Phycisphaerales bacterium]|nr:protein kinase [Phycisphaerales bacterium]